jgi:hypothetical protein
MYRFDLAAEQAHMAWIERYAGRAHYAAIKDLIVQAKDGVSEINGWGWCIQYSRRAGYYETWPFKYTDITEKCSHCGKYLRDNRDAPGRGAWLNPDVEWASDRKKDAWRHKEYGDLCLSCFNKHRPILRQIADYEQSRRFVAKAKREIACQ